MYKETLRNINLCPLTRLKTEGDVKDLVNFLI